MSEDEFQPRVGRIRSKGAGGARTFVGVALAAVARAGGLHRQSVRRSGAFGRGRPASLQSQRTLGPRSRGAVVKARVVRHLAGRGRLGTHLSYLQREGVTQDGERGRLFEAGGEEADGRAFAARCEPDRHHFRFIVSPDDAEQLADLKAYTRDLMRHAERDLGTRLDWVAVDHWNTTHPHVHVLVRGKGEDGRDLVISRDYIREGLRARAGQLVTLELGQRSDAELQRRLDQQVTSERWTPLDRGMAASAGEADGLLDLRPPSMGRPDPWQRARLTRLRKLEGLGLAEEVRSGRWRLAADAEPTLRALGRRGDIIARLHRAMTQDGLARDPASFVVDPEAAPDRIVGRLVGRGLDDELRGSGYAVVDGLDGGVHHVPVRDLDDAADAPVGAIVEARRDDRGPARLLVRSDLSVDQQVTAEGATWLDRQLVARTPESMGSGGFGEAVGRALEARTDHLAEAGLAARAVVEHAGQGVEGLVGKVHARLGRASFLGVESPGAETELWFAFDGERPVRFRFADTIRPDAAAAVAALKARGLTVEILSGDLAGPVSDVAEAVSITASRAGCTPQDKAAAIEALTREGRKVLMIGDGLNDAAALAKAHAAMAPGSALEASQNAADLVFSGAELMAVVEALDVARSARARAQENFGLAALYNLMAAPAAMLGLVNPFVAAIAMSGSSLAVTLNALRTGGRRWTS